ncbi:alpha-(1,3)-fucosyltransferase 7 [Pelobates fuscus]|uniref:alpha-(1,3)-fucosyltransferase 7 n=1 Tax=Pelobates fuscus TaxID=191477 RepID=UPI002FE43A2D
MSFSHLRLARNMLSKSKLRCTSVAGSFIMLVALVLNIRIVIFFVHESEESLSRPRNLTILIWHWPFHRSLNISGDVCSDLYNIQRCRLTDDREEYSHANVVVFHHSELGKQGCELPTNGRPQVQKWVWVTLESPSNIHGISKWNNIFNWTLSYREDSDIFVPYGKMVPRVSQIVHNFNKTGLVAWVVSHYRKTQKRSLFVKELSSHLNVEIFGRASKRPLCPTCLVPTASHYFFYLALENSEHQDYITEKLWKNAFIAGAVPIVLGPSRENYERFVPPDSFIHISDFPSPKDLAEFVLSMSPQRYLQFFRWKVEHEVKLYTDWRERFCMICAKYESLTQSKVYNDLEGWFNNSK